MHVVATAATLMVLVVLLYEGAAAEVVSPEEIFSRVSMASASIQSVVSADAVFKLWIKKPVTEPPDCVFTGTLRLERGRQALSVGGRTSGTVCWAVNQYVIGRLFEASEPVGTFLSRFNLTVLGEKLVEKDHYYLI